VGGAGGVLVDTHCHLGDPAFDGDRPAVLGRAAEAGVGHVVVVGDSLQGSSRALDLARGSEGLSATAGVHPHNASAWEGTATEVRALVRDETVVAVGETGLDYHYDHSPRDVQRRAFEAQLAIAAQVGKPVVVHARDADEDMAAMLRATLPKPPVIVLHSFSSGAGVFEAGMAVGAYFSFSGMITFKNWQPAFRLSVIPSDRLLVETDAPYLAPVPHRGKRNEPAFVRDVAGKLAELLTADPATLSEQLAANAERCFGVRLAVRLPAPGSRLPA
jgi:TatD DNase family protein